MALITSLAYMPQAQPARHPACSSTPAAGTFPTSWWKLHVAPWGTAAVKTVHWRRWQSVWPRQTSSAASCCHQELMARVRCCAQSVAPLRTHSSWLAAFRTARRLPSSAWRGYWPNRSTSCNDCGWRAAACTQPSMCCRMARPLAYLRQGKSQTLPSKHEWAACFCSAVHVQGSNTPMDVFTSITHLYVMQDVSDVSRGRQRWMAPHRVACLA